MAGVETFTDAHAVAAHAFPRLPLSVSGLEDAEGWLIDLDFGDPTVAADKEMVAVTRPDGLVDTVTYLTVPFARLRKMTRVSLPA